MASEHKSLEFSRILIPKLRSLAVQRARTVNEAQVSQIPFAPTSFRAEHIAILQRLEELTCWVRQASSASSTARSGHCR
jgi:hypothetical protein